LRPISARCAIDIALSDATALTRAERGTTVAAATITAVSILRQLNVRRGSIEPPLLREVEASAAAVTVAARLFVRIVRAIIERIRRTSTTVKRVELMHHTTGGVVLKATLFYCQPFKELWHERVGGVA
jgi:hypothetical protein